MRLFTRPSLLALLAACLFFCGCSPTVPTDAPAETAEPLPAPLTPAPTPRSGNPVWLFYQDFYGNAQEALDGMHAALAASSDPQALDGELLLSALEERLTEGMISFGLLMRADDGSQGYASSVEGAALGSGSISTSDGEQYRLSFTYADGVSLTGSLTPSRLLYARQAPEQPPAYSMLLLRASEGWAAVLDLGSGPAYTLRYGAQTGELGLYALSQQEGGAVSSAALTYDNCTLGALNSWLYQKDGLSMTGQE